MSLKAFMKSHLESLQSQIFTGLPAIVTDNSEYESKNIISVRPTIDMQHSDGQVSECPEIFNVPVINPSAGGGLLSFPIQIGDTVWLEFSMRNIEEWLEGDGSSVTEPTQRMHDMSDAVAIVGLYTKNSHLQPDKKDVVLKFRNNSIKLKDNKDIEIMNGNSGSGIDIKESGDINIFANGNMDISATGVITIAGSQVVVQG
jgi:hypothetical protein